MTWLLTYCLTNAVLVLPLAAVAFLVARCCKRPALAHLVWLVVLVKLVTPPVIPVPMGWEINPEAWTATESKPSSSGVSSSANSQIRRPASALQVSADLPASSVSSELNQERHSAGPRKRSSKRIVSQETQPPPVEVVPAVNVAPAESAITGRMVLALVCWTWVIGAVIMALRAIYHAWLFQRTLQKAGSADDWLNTRIARVARAAGLRSWPRVLVVDGTFSPMLWGIGRRARLIFPAELRARLDIPACDALLLHELAHYSRGDHWVRLLELVTQIAWWWHPVVWLAQREIEAAEEHCCDAWVITHQNGSRRTYAEALLATIDFLNEESPSLPPVASGLGEISLLRRRLMQIMQGEVTATLSPAVKVLVVAWAVVIAPLGPAVFASASPSARKTVALKSPVLSSLIPRGADASQLQKQTAPPAARPASAAPAISRKTAPAKPSSRSQSRIFSEQLRAAPWSPPPLWGAAHSPDGKYRLEVRTTDDSRRVTLLNTITGRPVDMTSENITGASFSHDSRLATAHDDGKVRIWDGGGGRIMRLEGANAAITSVAFSPDGRYVAAGTDDGRVLIWDAKFGDVVANLPEQATAVSCVRWSPDGDRLAISLAPWDHSDEAKLLIWNPTSDIVLHDFTLDQPAAALSWRDDDRLAVIGWGIVGDIWQLSTGERVSQFTVEKDAPSAANWSPDCPIVLRAQLPEPSEETIPADTISLDGFLAEAR